MKLRLGKHTWTVTRPYKKPKGWPSGKFAEIEHDPAKGLRRIRIVREYSGSPAQRWLMVHEVAHEALPEATETEVERLVQYLRNIYDHLPELWP